MARLAWSRSSGPSKRCAASPHVIDTHKPRPNNSHHRGRGDANSRDTTTEFSISAWGRRVYAPPKPSGVPGRLVGRRASMTPLVRSALRVSAISIAWTLVASVTSIIVGTRDGSGALVAFGGVQVFDF